MTKEDFNKLKPEDKIRHINDMLKEDVLNKNPLEDLFNGIK